MRIRLHNDDINGEYYFAIEGIPPNHYYTAEFLGMELDEFLELTERYGATKIQSGPGQLWRSRRERDDFLKCPELESYLVMATITE